MKLWRWIENLGCNVYRVCYWLPTIWKDRWWDDVFILMILERKLRYDIQRYEKYGCHAGKERDIKHMKIVAALCKRLTENNYNLFFSHEWVNESHGNIFDGHMEGEWIGEFAGIKWVYYEDYMRKQDLDYLCKILSKHLFEWWD